MNQPNVNNKKNAKQTLSFVYWKVHVLLSLLLSSS